MTRELDMLAFAGVVVTVAIFIAAWRAGRRAQRSSALRNRLRADLQLVLTQDEIDGLRRTAFRHRARDGSPSAPRPVA